LAFGSVGRHGPSLPIIPNTTPPIGMGLANTAKKQKPISAHSYIPLYPIKHP